MRDYGYGHIVKFDHDFVGRAALEKMADGPHRRKVTLVWNADDVLGVYQRLLEEGPLPMHVELPLAATARMHYDKVLGSDGEVAGSRPTRRTASTSARCCHSRRSRRRTPNREPRSCSSGARRTAARRSAPWIEPHVQVEIRATVAPAPISRAAQQYQSAWGAAGGSRGAAAACAAAALRGSRQAPGSL